MAIRLLADVQAGHADAKGAHAADEVQKPEMLLDCFWHRSLGFEKNMGG